MDQLRFHVLMRPWDATVALYIAHHRHDGVHLMQPGEFKQPPEGYNAISDEPTLKLTEEDAQALSDALAAIGIRPSTETRAEAKAVQSHLADLRRIAFKGLKMEDDA